MMKSSRLVTISLLIWGYCLTPFTSDGQELSILSYNIHRGQNTENEDQLDSMAHLINQMDPDVVGLQEVDSVCNRSGQVNQAKYLAEKTGMYYAFVRHFAFDGGAYGLALLSKYPILSVANNRLPIALEGETRAFLTAKIEIPQIKKSQLLIGVCHLDYRDSSSRVEQMKEVLEFYKKRKKYKGVLMGDFNSYPESEVMRLAKKGFKDVQQKDLNSFPATNPKKKIDYILTSRDFPDYKVIRNAILPVLYSDHLPVYTQLKLGK